MGTSPRVGQWELVITITIVIVIITDTNAVVILMIITIVTIIHLVQGVFLTVPPMFQYQKEKFCTANKGLLH